MTDLRARSAGRSIKNQDVTARPADRTKEANTIVKIPIVGHSKTRVCVMGQPKI